MSNKRVSIVFSTFNSSEYVTKCLKSCLTQEYDDFFVVVADDGSTDNTIDKMMEAANGHSNFKVISLPHGERGIARSKAIEMARQLKSDYIYIIDSDMILKNNLIKDCIKFLDENEKVGGLVIPEASFSDYKNFYSQVKVFERNIINSAGEDVGSNSVEGARFWRIQEYDSTGGININQISFEETQPTIRYMQNGGLIKRAVFTQIDHNEKKATLKAIVEKKKYYFSVMNKTIESEESGFKKTLSRWYFFRPVLYRKENLEKYIQHPMLTLGMIYMYIVLSFIGIVELLKSKKIKK
ncbi:chondroitin synthase [Clostridium puniceum]|uniref:Chondroitin synthase n=1 Tax=Clostridium puniceum TaxID=29367 RepID=A0A1S8TIX8_9CLOT|nr:glycosyltransferase family 2 protein [Clostridium puniceum]OOM77753.1 chondroitin synthase [Clostridium puniceum]